jgi:hypothetical protein
MKLIQLVQKYLLRQTFCKTKNEIDAFLQSYPEQKKIYGQIDTNPRTPQPLLLDTSLESESVSIVISG